MSQWLEHEAKAECLDLRLLRDQQQHEIESLRAKVAALEAEAEYVAHAEQLDSMLDDDVPDGEGRPEVLVPRKTTSEMLIMLAKRHKRISELESQLAAYRELEEAARDVDAVWLRSGTDGGFMEELEGAIMALRAALEGGEE